MIDYISNGLPTRVLLVDDEIIACKNLQTILKHYFKDEIEIVGMALDTKEAEIKIAKLQPEVVFLDIELGNENAFEFLNRIKPFSFEIVFVTAYDHYSLKALKLSALDYILKPISTEELELAVQKIRKKLSPQARQIDISTGIQLDHLNQHLDQGKKAPEKMILKSKTHIRAVAFSSIIYIEAKRAYSAFHFTESGKDSVVLMSKPLAEYVGLLPDQMFFRIHKSFLVNTRYISSAVLKGDIHEVILINGKLLPLSRRKYLDLQEFMLNSPEH